MSYKKTPSIKSLTKKIERIDQIKNHPPRIMMSPLMAEMYAEQIDRAHLLKN